MTLSICSLESPNYDARPAGAPVDMIVLHYTGMQSAEAALRRLSDRISKVSAHYLITEVGEVWALVDPEYRAWHAGQSYWRGREGLNAYSIGIELENPGHECGYRNFPAPQISACIELCKHLQERFPIDPRHVVGHSDIAPFRKQDPGELFPWGSLAEAGIGLYPMNCDHGERPEKILFRDGDKDPQVQNIKQMLKNIGYSTDSEDSYDKKFSTVVTAFQRRFAPRSVDGNWTEECQKMAEALQPLYR